MLKQPPLRLISSVRTIHGYFNAPPNAYRRGCGCLCGRDFRLGNGPSLMPPFGGGWRCYAGCTAMVSGVAVVVSVLVLVSGVGKAVAPRLVD